MRRIDYLVPEAYNGRKVLHFLRGGAGCSYSLVRTLKTQQEGILKNGVRTRTIDLVKAGDIISITLQDSPKQAENCDLPVEILYEDEDVIVYQKPAAMACHQVRNLQQGTLANVFAAHCAAQGTPRTFRILNRLDRDTTGAALIAKNAFAAAALSKRVEKVYLAVTQGIPQPEKGAIDAPIGQPDRCDPCRKVMETGQQAVTLYEVIGKQMDTYAFVKCILQTGRTHQIRVHMAHIGHPLLGDALYGGDCAQIGRQALHCAQVSFVHPVKKERMTIHAPLPEDMKKLALGCGFHVEYV